MPVAASAQDGGAPPPDAGSAATNAVNAPTDTANAIVVPRPLVPLEVDYPEGASGAATVQLALTIDAAGAVTAANVVRGDEPFATAARERATSWRFSPALRDGKPIASVIRVEVRFRPPPPPEEEPTAPSPDADWARPQTPGQPAPPKTPAPPVEVVIRGARPSPPSVSSLGRAEVRQLPGAFGDPFRAIEVMPGVTPIISGLPYFFVRGAPPGNVGYFLDGVRVPLLYHFALGPSVVHPALIDRVDLYSGGYPARYGGYAGAIVAGETTSPADKFRGEGNIRLFDAGAIVEAPYAGGRGTVLAGGRYSYTAFLISQLAPNTIVDYWDYQTRASYDLDKKNRVTGFVFGSFDLAGEKRDGALRSGASTEFHRADLRFDHDFGFERTTRFALTLGYDRTRSFESNRPSPYVRDRLLALRNQTSVRLDENLVLRTGAEAGLDVYDVQFEANDLPDLFTTRRDLALSAYAEIAWKPTPRIEVTPGLRGAFYASKGGWASGLDPRISAAFAITDKIRLLHAYGIAQQLPSFVIPIPGFQIADIGGGLQWALQSSAGVEATLPAGFTLTTNVFHNAFFNMTDSLATEGYNDQSSDNQTFGQRTRGSAFGVEVWLRRRLTERLGGFITYTLSRSERTFNAHAFASSFDRTHVLNAALAYDLGRSWRAGTRFVYYSGRPRNPLLDSNFDISMPGSPDMGGTGFIRGTGRMPGFYRIDARIEKRWRIGESGWISFVVEALNTTLQKEIVSESCSVSVVGLGGNQPPTRTSTCRYNEIGPITVPSIGVEGGF